MLLQPHDVDAGGCVQHQLINNIVRPTCAILGANPLWWIAMFNNKVNWKQVRCTPFQGKTYNGGSCALNDMQLDNARIGAAIGFSTAIQTAAAPTPTCFNKQDFLNSLAVFLDPVPVVTVGLGIGSYTDLESAVEYLALASSKVNKDFWRFLGAANPQADPNQVLFVLPGGASLVLGGTAGGNFFRGCSLDTGGPSEQLITYEGCNTVIKSYLVPAQSPLTGRNLHLYKFVNKFYNVVTDAPSWGIENICNYHEQYCTGSYKQFANFAECKRFMQALPRVSPACGNGLIMSGNSTTCRFKHSFMVPLAPQNHCFHIGYGDMPDSNGKFKCSDATECVPSSLAASDPTPLDLVPSAEDASCMAQDASSYVTWQPPSGVCPESIVGRRRRMLRNNA